MDNEAASQETSRRRFMRGALAAGAAIPLATLAVGPAQAGVAGAPRGAPAGRGAAAGDSTFVYIGTFTGPSQAEGIYVHRMDSATGTLTRVHTVPADNPSFLALDPTQPYLYAVNSMNDYEGRRSGSVSAYALNPATGALTFLNRLPSNGRRPIHLSVEPSGRYVLVANITEGTVAMLPI